MQFHTGALESKYDIRDYWYEPADKGAFDWDTGYDVEEALGFKLDVKNQGSSGSCGGQAWGYYGEVLSKVATQSYIPSSARWIYSHTFVAPGGGSRGRDNCSFCIKNGWVDEKYATSYENGKPPSEDFMRIVPNLTKDAIEDNEEQKALSYLRIAPNIELFAQAIQDNHGLVLVLNGQDNSTWHSGFPRPPMEKEWGHFLYAGKVKKMHGDKYIGVLNSWGDKIGEGGWQWLHEDWFRDPTLGVREGWTMQWDYSPSRRKLLMKQIISALQTIVSLLQMAKNKA